METRGYLFIRLGSHIDYFDFPPPKTTSDQILPDTSISRSECFFKSNNPQREKSASEKLENKGLKYAVTHK